jgi:hypothetical protein
MDYFAELTEAQIRSFIEANYWKLGKNMKPQPHEYCLKESCTDPEMFERFVMHIRRHGYEQRFWKKTYLYYDIDGHQYWTMGSPLHKTILINRAVIKSPEAL